MKKGFLIVAHGSRKSDANHHVVGLVDRLSNYFQTEMFEPAFMRLASPTLEDSIRTLASKNIDQLIAYPYFLVKGVHFTKDIPKLIEDVVNKLERKISFKVMDPIGHHPKIIDLIQENLYDEVLNQLNPKEVEPAGIEDKSMELIEKNLNGHKIPDEQKPIIKRVIHTTGDFDFLTNMIFHKDAVSAGLKAILEKKTIYTDVSMVKAGINKRHGHDVRCVLHDPEIKELAKKEGITISAASIKTIADKLDGNIVAIGNAPTALITLVDKVKNNGLNPALIVGIPVGFVNAKESKSYLTTIKDIPYITNRGQKGGSTVAVAIINALMKIAFN